MEEHKFTVELFATEADANARNLELGARFSHTAYSPIIKTGDNLYGLQVLQDGPYKVSDSGDTRELKFERYCELLEEAEALATENLDG